MSTERLNFIGDYREILRGDYGGTPGEFNQVDKLEYSLEFCALNQKKHMKQNETMPTKIQLKAYSLGEMAGLYDVSERTFKTWLNPFQKDIGKKNGRYFTPKQIKLIFEKLGLPDTIFLN